MKKTIERFNITVAPIQKVSVPYNSEILNFDILNGVPGFNAIVEDGQKANERTLFITTFSKELPIGMNSTKFIGEFQLSDRRLGAKRGANNVFFVFEE